MALQQMKERLRVSLHGRHSHSASASARESMLSDTFRDHVENRSLVRSTTSESQSDFPDNNDWTLVETPRGRSATPYPREPSKQEDMSADAYTSSNPKSIRRQFIAYLKQTPIEEHVDALLVLLSKHPSLIKMNIPHEDGACSVLEYAFRKKIYLLFSKIAILCTRDKENRPMLRQLTYTMLSSKNSFEESKPFISVVLDNILMYWSLESDAIASMLNEASTLPRPNNWHDEIQNFLQEHIFGREYLGLFQASIASHPIILEPLIPVACQLALTHCLDPITSMASDRVPEQSMFMIRSNALESILKNITAWFQTIPTSTEGYSKYGVKIQSTLTYMQEMIILSGRDPNGLDETTQDIRCVEHIKRSVDDLYRLAHAWKSL